MKYVHGEKALLVAIGEMAIKDYKFYIRRHNRLVKAKRMQENKRKLYLYHNAAKMRDVEYFFIDDPYDMFSKGVGEKAINKLRKDNGYIPCEIISDADYVYLSKNS